MHTIHGTGIYHIYIFVDFYGELLGKIYRSSRGWWVINLLVKQQPSNEFPKSQGSLGLWEPKVPKSVDVLSIRNLGVGQEPGFLHMSKYMAYGLKWIGLYRTLLKQHETHSTCCGCWEFLFFERSSLVKHGVILPVLLVTNLFFSMFFITYFHHSGYSRVGNINASDPFERQEFLGEVSACDGASGQHHRRWSCHYHTQDSKTSCNTKSPIFDFDMFFLIGDSPIAFFKVFQDGCM